jgi:hypothetical protein
MQNLLWSAVASAIPRLRTTPIFKGGLQQRIVTGEMGFNGHFAAPQPRPLAGIGLEAMGVFCLSGPQQKFANIRTGSK